MKLIKSLKLLLRRITKDKVAIALVAVILGYGSAKLVVNHLNKQNLYNSTLVVKYLTQDGIEKVQGTAFHIRFKRKSYILTNFHICDDALRRNYTTLKMTNYGQQPIYGDILAYDTGYDLCLLKPRKESRNKIGLGLELAKKYPPKFEEYLTLLGSSNGLPYVNISGVFKKEDIFKYFYNNLPENLCRGKSARFISQDEIPPMVQQLMRIFSGCQVMVPTINIDKPCPPGSSGSPMVNSDYKIQAIVSNSSPVSCGAVPNKFILEFLNEYESSNKNK